MKKKKKKNIQLAMRVKPSIDRLDTNQKKELLFMLTKDKDTFKMAEIMCLAYIREHPNEKHFKKKVKNAIKAWWKIEAEVNWTTYSIEGHTISMKSTWCYDNIVNKIK